MYVKTIVKVNKNYAAAIHVDRNNEGPSVIIGLGDYEGGQLWTYDQGPLDIKNKVISCQYTYIVYIYI
jgi:hypothetical protein